MLNWLYAAFSLSGKAVLFLSGLFVSYKLLKFSWRIKHLICFTCLYGILGYYLYNLSPFWVSIVAGFISIYIILEKEKVITLFMPIFLGLTGLVLRGIVTPFDTDLDLTLYFLGMPLLAFLMTVEAWHSLFQGWQVRTIEEYELRCQIKTIVLKTLAVVGLWMGCTTHPFIQSLVNL